MFFVFDLYLKYNFIWILSITSLLIMHIVCIYYVLCVVGLCQCI